MTSTRPASPPADPEVDPGGHPRPEERSRGLWSPLHPQVIGALVGASGGTAFVLANRGALPDPWPTVALLAWLVALAGWAWTVLLRPRHLPPIAPARPGAGVVYVVSVAGMLAGFAAGRVLLEAAGHPGLMPAVVVVAVGLHFVPFARAFRAPVFGVLGWTLAAVGFAGLLLGLALGAGAAALAAVLTGLVMLGVMALDAVRPAVEPSA
ncbi:hypothetical protein [Phycicoccus sonneratiae]|uniref:Uncharacterized protein n=1 Tax=Phycicoccus sonneratiae TaxID=2807628 RepID=A0ABS2CMW3_9MICO|nr:hypothetical protein [Phycicoccus sonneraticus]MBM6401208.1 hypothetical protein [Phycicoccus sonneraticus]